MQYIYHYHAMHMLSMGSLHHIDGIATMDKQIGDWDQYYALKLHIAKKSEIPVEKLTICSLTLISSANAGSMAATPEQP